MAAFMGVVAGACVLVPLLGLGQTEAGRTAAHSQASPPTLTTVAKPGPALTDVRFEHVDVFVDAGAANLAAYQVEITGTAGRVAVVGIEGGEGAVFKDPPYYDERAMQHERVILGAFSTGDGLPTGEARVARLHVRVSGQGAAEYTVKLVTAATAGGKKIAATARVGQGEGK